MIPVRPYFNLPVNWRVAKAEVFFSGVCCDLKKTKSDLEQDEMNPQVHFSCSQNEGQILLYRWAFLLKSGQLVKAVQNLLGFSEVVIG